MKFKFLAVLAVLAVLACAVSSVYAQTSVLMSYGTQDDKYGGDQAHVNVLQVKTRILEKIDGDVMIINKTVDDTHVVLNRTEIGGTYFYPVGIVTPSLRISSGIKQKSGAESYYYYTAEPGVSVGLPYGFSAKVSYFYRQSYNPNVNLDMLTELRYVLGYNVTEKDKISVGQFKDLSGYNQGNTTFVGYTRTF
jgi:hypothetical protein